MHACSMPPYAIAGIALLPSSVLVVLGMRPNSHTRTGCAKVLSCTESGMSSCTCHSETDVLVFYMHLVVAKHGVQLSLLSVHTLIVPFPTSYYFPMSFK